MKALLILTITALAAVLSLPCAAQSYTGTNVGAIPDGLPAGLERYGPPRDVYFDVGLLRTVSQVTVSFTATHAYVGDLRVTLIAPNGNSHLLFARTGALDASSFGYSSDLDGSYTFTDDPAIAGNWWIGAANNPVPGGSYRTVISGGAGVSNPPPVTSINTQFLSTPANGRWILRFEDGYNTDTGAVSAATLNLTLVGSTRTVTNANDSGSGSLRGALLAANSGDYIRFATPFFASARTIELLTPLPVINQSIAIQGPGAAFLTIRPAATAGDMRIFEIAQGVAGVSLSGMTTNGGRVGGVGGAISTRSTLTLSGMHVSGNRSEIGGAGIGFVFAGGQIIDSTISGNTSPALAGAIYAFGGNGRPLRILNSTISGNYAFAAGGVFFATDNGSIDLEVINSTVANNRGGNGEANGVYVRADGPGSASARIRNSIVANNGAANFQTGVSSGGTATITSLGFNLSEDYNGALTTLGTDVTGDPKLGPLAPLGGSTPTHLLLGGSAALNAGNTSGSVIDQRGRPRPWGAPAASNGGDGADIGAVEMRSFTVINTNDSGIGSLRDAIVAANADTELNDIVFLDGLFASPRVITLESALPDINNAITISGPGADKLSIRRGSTAPLFRLFTISSGLEVAALTGIKLQNGSVNGFGGGIDSQSPLTLAGVHVLGNFAGAGGAGVSLFSAGGTFLDSTFNGNTTPGRPAGIYVRNSGALPLRIVNSTISGNTAGGTDGAILNLADAGASSSIELINSTVAENAGTATGGIASVSLGGDSATAEVRNTIVTDNAPNNLGTFASTGVASLRSRGYNLSNTNDGSFFDQVSDQNNINPQLLPLALNGGTTPTHGLIASSAAVDAGDSGGSGVLTDQRGVARPIDLPLANVGDGTDIGAFEAEPDNVFANGFE